jgi:hypothetical protein
VGDLLALAHNPLFVKHLRAKLRSQQLVPAIIAVVMVCGLILWWFVDDKEKIEPSQFVFLLVLQGGLLFLGGSSSVATSVAYARENGLLDFHRISPQRPLALALGFILGGPIREWLLFACTLPFSAVCAAGLARPVEALLVYVAVIAAALLYHSFAALTGLTATRAREAMGATVVLVVLLHMISMSPLGLLTAVPTIALALAPAGVDQVGPPGLPGGSWAHSLHPIVPTLWHMIPLMVFIVIAVERKLRNAVAPGLSKPQVVVFQVFLSVLALGDVWEPVNRDAAAICLGTGLAVATLAGLVLCASITPGLGRFANGVRRARKWGQEHAPVWSDLAANWAPLLAMAAVVVILGVLSGSSFFRNVFNPDPPEAVLVEVMVVSAASILVSFGSALQFFGLRYGKAGIWYMALTFFVLWVIPIPVAGLLGLSSTDWTMNSNVASICPFVGIGYAAMSLAGAVGPQSSAKSIHVADAASLISLIFSLLTTAIFIYLALSAQRRATEAA